MGYSEEASLNAFAADSAVQAHCLNCGVLELVMALPGEAPLDEVFLAHYTCEECDQKELEGCEGVE